MLARLCAAATSRQIRCQSLLVKEPTWSDGVENVAPDPLRHFTTVKCRTAKGSFAFDVGHIARASMLAGQENGRPSSETPRQGTRSE
jgi:hypothetical protein